LIKSSLTRNFQVVTLNPWFGSGLANYFAGALVLPYLPFLEAAEGLRYDIDLLVRRFHVGFETVAHRLSTLQRPGAGECPSSLFGLIAPATSPNACPPPTFIFRASAEVVRSGMSTRHFHTPIKCTLSSHKCRTVRSYMWIARTVSRSNGGYGTPSKTFSIGLGCDLHHAHRLVYSDGLDLSTSASLTPIGPRLQGSVIVRIALNARFQPSENLCTSTLTRVDSSPTPLARSNEKMERSIGPNGTPGRIIPRFTPVKNKYRTITDNNVLKRATLQNWTTVSKERILFCAEDHWARTSTSSDVSYYSLSTEARQVFLNQSAAGNHTTKHSARDEISNRDCQLSLCARLVAIVTHPITPPSRGSVSAI